MLLTLLRPRNPQRGARTVAAGSPDPDAPVASGRYPYSPVRAGSPWFVVARGPSVSRGPGVVEHVLYDGGTMDRSQDPDVAKSQRWPSQADVVTRTKPAPSRRWAAPVPGKPLRSTGFLLALQVRPGLPVQTVYRRDEYDVSYSPPPVAEPPSFPTQVSGLRIYDNGVAVELCLVAEAEAPTGMGGAVIFQKGAISYAVYLVETTDPNASRVRIQTTSGVKAVRLKT